MNQSDQPEFATSNEAAPADAAAPAAETAAPQPETPAAEESAAPETPPAAENGTAAPGQGADTVNVNAKINEAIGSVMKNVSDYTGDFSQEDIAGNKNMAAVSYLGLLLLIPLFAAPQSKFARFHVNQGLMLMICSFVLAIAAGVVGTIALLVPILGALVAVLLGIACSASVIAMAVIGILNAVNGRARELPFIGKYRILS